MLCIPILDQVLLVFQSSQNMYMHCPNNAYVHLFNLYTYIFIANFPPFMGNTHLDFLQHPESLLLMQPAVAYGPFLHHRDG